LTDRKVDLKIYLSDKRKIVENSLDGLMPPADGPFADHIRAMRYSLFVGGKRVRPILCLATAEAIDNRVETMNNLLPVACALECIHTYSLIHDDLPAMDNDDLRRGQPTNHTLFGEAGAILAGDGLLTFAFELLSGAGTSTLPAEKRLKIIQEIAQAAGPLAMVGGQALDIASENSKFSFQTLETIHRGKTGALITAAVRAGAIGAGASAAQLEQLTCFGDKIGLAFQIVDDLLNATSTTAQLGKATGSDANRGKATYPSFFGIDQTRVKAKEAVDAAIAALGNFDEKADPLRHLAAFVYTRSN
jgi:geranylgeranyl diphosphate synthase, type II